MKIRKRDGRIKDYDFTRIQNAILKATNDVEEYKDTTVNLQSIFDDVENKIKNYKKDIIDIETIQDIILKVLYKHDRKIYKSFKTYRDKREIIRTASLFAKYRDEIVNKFSDENSNANLDENSFSGREDRVREVVFNKIADTVLPQDILDAERKGELKIHDRPKFALGQPNCLQMNWQHILYEDGFKVRQGDTRSTTHYSTALQLLAVSIQIQSQQQFGGCSIPNFSLGMVDELKMTISEITKMVCDIREIDINIPDKLGFDDVKNLIRSKKTLNLIQKYLNENVRRSNQALITNLVTLQSRSGNQLPFSSINFGLIDPNNKLESAYLCEMMLLAIDKGIGKYGRSAIFPVSCFQIKGGVNRYPKDEFYYLRLLAQKVSHKRLYPTFVNGDFSHNIIQSPNSEMNIMGCVDGEEVVTYKYNENLYVESFTRMWNRMTKMFNVKEQNVSGNFYIDLSNVKIYDSNKKDFVNCFRIIQNKDKGDWNLIKLSNGRTLLCTSDHPLPIINKGRTLVKDVKIGDNVPITNEQYSENNVIYDNDKAWLLGFVLCDGCYDRQYSSSIAIDGEDDICEKYVSVNKEKLNLDIDVINWNRDKNGDYKELKCKNYKNISQKLIDVYDGLQKENRHIPTCVWTWNKEAKFSFLAGMIDADGYINDNKGRTVQIGSTNKELAIQQMKLAQTLGFNSKLYLNNYTKEKDKIRYRVEFECDDELLKYIVCNKKKQKYFLGKQKDVVCTDIASIKEIRFLGSLNKCSYDVTTESDMFEVSGIQSHNCRTMMGYDRFNPDEPYNKIGRGNNAPNTIDLPYIALEYNGDENKFFKRLDEVLLLSRKAHLIRWEIMKKQNPQTAQFTYDNKTIFGAEDCKDNVENALKHGSFAFGYIGVAEACKVITGCYHNQSKEAKELGEKMIKRIYDFCKKYEEIDNLNYSVYAAPCEGYCEKACDYIKRDFGIIEGISDKDYITNSHHVPVSENINVFDKVDVESPYAKWALGGNIFHIEVEGVTYNEKAITKAIDYALDKDIPYIRLSHPIATCLSCGHSTGRYMDICEVCGSSNVENLAIVTGYLSTDISHMNKGKQDEVRHRRLNIEGEK